jgi:hypothetical protein
MSYLKTVFFLSLSILSLNLLNQKAFASSSFYGDSGYINTPNSENISDRGFDFGLSYFPGTTSYLRIGKPNLLYSLSLGFIPRTEVGLVYNQIMTGIQDSDNPYMKGSSFDRTVFVKFQILDESEYIPSLSIGGRDIISNSVINRRAELVTAHQQVFYASIGKKFFDYKVNLGYSYDPSIPFGFENINDAQGLVLLKTSFRMNGFFGAIETPKYFSLVSAIIEYDSKKLNYGLDLGPFYNLNAKLVMMDLSNFNVRVSWSKTL